MLIGTFKLAANEMVFEPMVGERGLLLVLANVQRSLPGVTLPTILSAHLNKRHSKILN